MDTIMFEAVLEDITIDARIGEPKKAVRITLVTRSLAPEQVAALYERLIQGVTVRLK